MMREFRNADFKDIDTSPLPAYALNLVFETAEDDEFVVRTDLTSLTRLVNAALTKAPDPQMVERVARELHAQRGEHPASWDGHYLTAAKAVLHVALTPTPEESP